MRSKEIDPVSHAQGILADLCAALRMLPAPQRAPIAASFAREVLRTLAPTPPDHPSALDSSHDTPMPPPSVMANGSGLPA